jgi:capsular polysaccharide biosynthesis protein
MNRPHEVLRRLSAAFRRPGALAAARAGGVRDRVYPTTWSWAALQEAHEPRALFHPLDPPTAIFRRRPVSADGAVHGKFLPELYRESPATFVARVPAGRAFGPAGSVFAPDGRLLADVSVELGRPVEEYAALGEDPGPPAEIDGTVVVLTVAGGENYFHWLFDLLPRLDLLRRSGVRLRGDERYLVNSLASAFQRETLQRLGVPLDRVIESARTPHLRASELIVPSLSGNTGNPSGRACDFLRELRVPAAPSGEPPGGGHRLYLSRSGARSRRIANEEEVVERLRALGFSVAAPETLSFPEQARLFADAEAIVAPHGAALANAVFCRPGTRIVELFAPGYVNVCYWALANQVGLDYRYLLAREAADGAGRPTADLLVDPTALAATLAAAGVQPAARSPRTL